VLCKLHSIVERNRFYSYLILHLSDTFHYITTRFISKFKHTWKSCFSIYESKNNSLESFLRYYEVCFKMTYFTPIFIFIVSLLYSYPSYDFRFLFSFVCFVAFVAMSKIFLILISISGFQPSIDTGMRYLYLIILIPLTSYYFWRYIDIF